MKQDRNQESQGEKNHISLQLRNRFSLCEDRVVASHEFQIRSYLEISGSIFEQTVPFTFLSNIHAICSVFHQFKEKIGVIWIFFFHSRSLSDYAITLKIGKSISKISHNLWIKASIFKLGQWLGNFLNYDVTKFDVNRM